MQIRRVEVTPVSMKLKNAARMAKIPPVEIIDAFFVRLETVDGRNAWGCGVAHPDLTGESAAEARRACQACADMAPDLHPTDIEYSLAKLAPLTQNSPAAACAFDLAFYDLLGLATGMPMHRLLGGYRQRIPTSATIPIISTRESVELAKTYARQGFQRLKIKGGEQAEADVQRVRAIHRALPQHRLRLDADGGYSLQETLEVARALSSILETLEQPTPAEDLQALRTVTEQSPLPIFADQSASSASAALQLASQRAVNGMCLKVACGGLGKARQMEAISRAAHLDVMISCLIEPALLTAAGLSLALSSPVVTFADLDGHLELINDPTLPGFHLEDGELVATDVPGLGCRVELQG